MKGIFIGVLGQNEEKIKKIFKKKITPYDFFTFNISIYVHGLWICYIKN